MKTVTNAKIDRLGDRLRSGNIADEHLQLLDAYRRSFTPAYEAVVEALRDNLGLEPTGRPAKSTTSIGDKLRRESIRLSQMQDIAGCRVIVGDVLKQDEAVALLTRTFPESSIYDRREKPSHGYRAVHVIVRNLGMPVEVQIRTSLEHTWAELSEKLSDVVDPSVKYGGGPEELRRVLILASATVGQMESTERELMTAQLDPASRESMAKIAKTFAENKRKLTDLFETTIARL